MDNLDVHINYCTAITVLHGIRQETEQAVNEVQTVRDNVRANVHLTWVVVNVMGVSRQGVGRIRMDMKGKLRARRKEWSEHRK